MNNSNETGRRSFLKSVALAGTASIANAGANPPTAERPQTNASREFHERTSSTDEVAFPRSFSGPALAMISYPLGGIGAGSIGLGGRGQLRDWEIFNRADKGNSLPYAFPSIWIQTEGSEPVAHVLEARIEPPYEGADGLGSHSAPGLSRLQGATFTGEFPLARIDFHDQRLPVQVTLEAWSPFIPLDADESGLPAATLRYRVRNSGKSAASVSIAFSIENPVQPLDRTSPPKTEADKRINTLRSGQGFEGIFMQNPELSKDDPGFGSFALAVLTSGEAHFTSLRGWPAAGGTVPYSFGTTSLRTGC